MNDRKELGIVEHECLYLCDLNANILPNNLTEKFGVEVEQWNGHDYKNLIAFKNRESFIYFTYALSDLAKFYRSMNQMSNTSCFNILFKSYTKDNLTELNKDSCNFIRENYWDDILEFADKGYYFMYFTTQRECHDKNHFLMYMLDNWLYERKISGHRVNEEDEIKDIEFIVLNER